MSVLIKGIEMPKNGCSDCVLVNRKWTGDVCKILKKEVSGNVERGGFQTDCPLIEVPDHGRLVDADALMERFNQFCEYNCDYTKKQRDIMCGSCGIGCAIDMLDDAPTVIPAEPPKEES